MTNIKTIHTVPTQVFSHTEEPQPGLVDTIRNIEGFMKPNGGIWTCPVGADGWKQWCESEDFGDHTNYIDTHLTVDIPVKVAVIDSKADLLAVIAEYGYVAPYSLRGWQVIDFEEMVADGWDGIWLTEAGQRATRFGDEANLYGWDMECVLWFNWVFQPEQVDIYTCQGWEIEMLQND